MVKHNYIVYQHITPSKKSYIGITCQKPERRWRNGNGYIPSNGKMTPFANAIVKYGWKNIEHRIIAENLTHDEACEMEMNLIALFRTNDSRFGYNVLNGGDVPLFDCPDSVKEKMRESSYKKWKKEEYKKSHTGKNHWTHKKGFSQKSVDAMKRANKGRKRTEKEIEAMRERARHQERFYGADNKTSKAVVCFTKEGIEVARYGGICEAGRQTGISFQGISKVCLKQQKTAGGFVWIFETEVNNND